MPDIWTHILCGIEAIEGIKDNELKNEIKKGTNLFNLGTQGPDIFYYYRFLNGINNSYGGNLGRLMHTRETGEFFVQGLYFLNKINNRSDYMKMLVYLSGFMCHFTLDSICHPYIYYSAEKESIIKNEEYLLDSYHKKLEIIIDTLLLESKTGIKSFLYPAYREIDVGEKMPQIILDFLERTINYLYGIKIGGNQINSAYRDMKTGLRILHDPNGIKISILSILEKILKCPDKYTCAIYPKRISTGSDYLNTKHSVWNHPLNYSEKSNSSFYDLFTQAVIESREMIDTSLNFLSGKSDRQELGNIFSNSSYLTGKPTKQNK